MLLHSTREDYLGLCCSVETVVCAHGVENPVMTTFTQCLLCHLLVASRIAVGVDVLGIATSTSSFDLGRGKVR